MKDLLLGNITVSDKLDKDGEVELTIMDTDPDSPNYEWIDKGEAMLLIAHLNKVFDL